jgi:DNA repair/transcription protein MET18/MMS19
VHTHAKTFWDWLRLEIFQPSDEQTAEDAIQAAKALVSLLDPVSGSSSILVPTSTASHVHAHDHEHDHEHDHDHKHDHDHSDAHVHGPAQSTASDISPSTHMELQSTKSNLSDITTSIISECLSLLSHPEKSQATYATQVLAAFLSGTTRIASETLAQGVPHLLKIFRDPDEISNRGSALLHLARLADAARESSLVAQTQQTTNASNKDPLLGPYKDEVLGAFTSGLKTDSPGTASPALEGLKALVQTPRLLSDEEVGYVVHSVNELLQYFFALPPSSSSTSSVSTPTPPSEETSDGTLSLLLSISSSPAPSWARHVEMQTLPLLFAGLPDEPVHRDDETRRQSVWRTLEFLGKLCVHPGLFNVLVVRMLAKVDLLVAHLPSHDSSSPMAEPGADSREQEHQEAGVAYAHACLHTLATVLEKKVGAKDVDVERHVHKLVPQLFGLFIASALETHAPVSVVASAKGKGKAQAQSIANQPRLVDVAGRIVTLVLRGTSAA